MCDYETLEIVGTAVKETITKNKGQKSRGKIFATHNRDMELIQLIRTKVSAVSQKKTYDSVGKVAKVISKQLTEKDISRADTYMKSNTRPHL